MCSTVKGFHLMIGTMRKLFEIFFECGRSLRPRKPTAIRGIDVFCHVCGKRIASVKIEEASEGGVRLQGIETACVKVDFISQNTLAFIHADLEVCEA